MQSLKPLCLILVYIRQTTPSYSLCFHNVFLAKNPHILFAFHLHKISGNFSWEFVSFREECIPFEVSHQIWHGRVSRKSWNWCKRVDGTGIFTRDGATGKRATCLEVMFLPEIFQCAQMLFRSGNSCNFMSIFPPWI